MKILQLIDSLDAGGAERMAVNYANALQKEIAFSALCATRKEGQLKNMLLPDVAYLFLAKKKAVDFKAVFKLRTYVKKHQIDFVHAHSTSFFIAVLLKFVYPRIKIVWHDHYGARYLQPKNKNLSLKLASFFFAKVLTINFENKQWLKSVLLTKEIHYFPNFIVAENNHISTTELKGEKGKRIVFLANLRNPKNHLQFLNAFLKSQAFLKGWTVHLIGKDYEDDYSKEIKNFIEEKKLKDNVFLYGSCTDTFAILNQANVGVLCSTHEGFPVTLLEYGCAKLAVLSTNVGFCSSIIQDKENGFLFSPLDKEELLCKLNKLTEGSELTMVALKLYETVKENYTDKVVIQNYIEFLR